MIELISAARTEDIFRAVGLCGFVLYVAVYACLSFRIVTGDCLSYFMGNTAAAALVLVGLSHEFNLAAALIQMFWISIGIVAIALRLAHRASDRRAVAAARKRADTLARVSRAAPPAAATGPRRPAAKERAAPAEPERPDTAPGCAIPVASGYRSDTAV